MSKERNTSSTVHIRCRECNEFSKKNIKSGEEKIIQDDLCNRCVRKNNLYLKYGKEPGWTCSDSYHSKNPDDLQLCISCGRSFLNTKHPSYLRGDILGLAALILIISIVIGGVIISYKIDEGCVYYVEETGRCMDEAVNELRKKPPRVNQYSDDIYNDPEEPVWFPKGD